MSDEPTNDGHWQPPQLPVTYRFVENARFDTRTGIFDLSEDLHPTAAPLMAHIEALEAALECALALCATPIARRRLGIDPNTNEMLRTARAALAKEPTE